MHANEFSPVFDDLLHHPIPFAPLVRSGLNTSKLKDFFVKGATCLLSEREGKQESELTILTRSAVAAITQAATATLFLRRRWQSREIDLGIIPRFTFPFRKCFPSRL